MRPLILALMLIGVSHSAPCAPLVIPATATYGFVFVTPFATEGPSTRRRWSALDCTVEYRTYAHTTITLCLDTNARVRWERIDAHGVAACVDTLLATIPTATTGGCVP